MRRTLRGLFWGLPLAFFQLAPIATGAPSSSGAVSSRSPVLLITDPAALSSLEETNLDIGQIAFGATAPTRDLASLAKLPLFRSLASTLKRDLTARKASDSKLGVGMQFSHRLFDDRWLASKEAHFELIGVANRLDREIFTPGYCGEVRLIYRLAYKTKQRGTPIGSRLPMTINVVFYGQEPQTATAEAAATTDGAKSCQQAASSWTTKQSRSASNGFLQTAAAIPIALSLRQPGGPLSPALLTPKQLKSIEINLQSVRWPSTVRPDMGNHAEYLLRVFRPSGSGRSAQLLLQPLENTPDVLAITKSPALRKELLNWIARPENLRAIDLGVAKLPEQFLAKTATSVAPRGSARLANRPFSQLFSPRDLQHLKLDAGRYVRSPAALIRRLDDLSCAGCHQGRSVAGFHLIGEDPPDTEPGNAIAVAGSPHLMGDLARRAAYVKTQSLTKKPLDEIAQARPFSERSDEDPGLSGSHCGLSGLGDPGFAHWTCAAGLECVAIEQNRGGDKNPVGTCQAIKPEAGDACELAEITPNRDPTRDRAKITVNRDCGEGACDTTTVGFPGGMCVRSCENPGPNGTCGVIAILAGFNSCLAAKKPFSTCLREHVRPAGLRSCSATMPCRDDYLCAKKPKNLAGSSDDQGSGVCIPPYFLFEMRVDGHTIPTNTTISR